LLIALAGPPLAEMARAEIGTVAGGTAAIAILFIFVNALAGLGLVVVKALGGETVRRPDGSAWMISGSSWGTFTIACTIPIALFVGLWMYRIRKGRVREASLIGASRSGLPGWGPDPGSPPVHLRPHGITLLIASYGFIASVLPVWLLLCPRDYLSSYMKIGTVAALVIGTILVNPSIKMPALTAFTAGGGPIIPGKVFPFVFITIMCGAISGFHALVSSGTTPKMLSKESHARPIGWAMLIEPGRRGRADRRHLAPSRRLLRHQRRPVEAGAVDAAAGEDGVRRAALEGVRGGGGGA
jgi:carbon starvation protein